MPEKLLFPAGEETKSLSKVIKACFVKDKNVNSSELNNLHTKNGVFTIETANDIYQETKTMIEELVAEAQKKANKIICDAEKQAKLLVTNSQSEYEKEKEKAYEDGIKLGYQEGMKKAEEDIKGLAEETKLLAKDLAVFKEKYLQDNMSEIIDLVIKISQKIIHTVVELKPEIIGSIVKNILMEVGNAEKIVIKVNPLHLPYLDLSDQQFIEIKNNKLCFEGDAEIEPGGCLVVTENGFVEAKIDEQLLLLKNALKEESNYVGF